MSRDEKNPSPERQKTIKLIKEIRKSAKYQAWRQTIIQRDIGDIKLPKRIQLQVHHKKEISDILYENDIRTLKEAYRCEELWELENGVTLKRGEHFILTKLRRYKYVTPGFREFIKEWINGCVIGLRREK